MMKKNKLVLLTTTGLLLVGLAGVKASAEDEVTPGNGVNETDTTVTIIDKNVDPEHPDVPNENELFLQHVPENFDFKTTLLNKDYSIESEDIVNDITKDNKIKVFNNYSERKWQVKAYINNAKFTRDSDGEEFVVTNFEINHTKIGEGTAKSAVVHENADISQINQDKSNLDKYVGTIPKDVTHIKIDFSDPDYKLKGGDKLKGEIKYTLGLTPADAK